MRYAGNFHPEWGYLSPAPSFVRTARVVLVATAIGATAGAAVVFSLIGRADTETSVAARTLAHPTEPVTSAELKVPQAVAPAPAAATPRTPAHAPKSLTAEAPRAGAADSESRPSSTTTGPAGIAALAEVPAATGQPSTKPSTNLAAAPSSVSSPEAQLRHAPPSPASSSSVATAKAAVSPPAAPAPAPAPAISADEPLSPASGSPASAVATAKTSVSPTAVSAPVAAPAAEKKIAVANVKKRVVPRFASRAASSRLTPGQYYMSAENYRESGARGYYRDSGWGGGNYYQGGGRVQDW